MSSNTNKKMFSTTQNSERRLLHVLLLLAIYLLIGQAHLIYSASTSTNNVPYDYDTKSFVIADSFTDGRTIYLDNHLIIVPNVTSEYVRSNFFKAKDYSAYSHAEEASISNVHGWNDIGSNGYWMFSNSSPNYMAKKDINGNDMYSTAYVFSVQMSNGIHSFNLNTPQVAGTADIFCNGVHVKRVSSSEYHRGFVAIPNTFDSVKLQTDANGRADIIITVSCSTNITNPGILSVLSISNNPNNVINIVISSIWFAILVILMVTSVIGGFIISTTFNSKAKFYALFFIILTFITYLGIDTGYLFFGLAYENAIKNALIALLGILTYCSVEALIDNTKEKKRNSIFRFDHIIVTVIGVILIALSICGKNVIEPSFITTSLTIFTLLGTTISIAKVFMLYFRNTNSTLTLNSLITALFCYLFMFDNQSTRLDIKAYSYFFVVGMLVLEMYFIIRYVNQYYELRNSSDKLKYLVKEKTLHISEINRDLYNTNKKLLQNEEARKNVLSNVSHDLRTPITAIRGYAELLISAGKNMKEEQVALYLQNIIKRSKQMERIVSDIVELTRMESNNNEFKFNDISLAEMLDEIYMMFSGELQGTKKRITLDIPEDDLLIVKADYKKISRVFENLVSNSINYTYDEALISMKAWREGKELPLSDQRIHITIKDNGIGIPEEELPHIFDRFYRAKNSGQNIKGTGLGLSIVDSIIKHHDAEISVESKLGSGTQFHIVMKATY